MNRLKILREEKNLFQSDLAKVLNVSIAAYSFYESGKRDMGTDTIKKLADFFKVSTDYLLGISDIRNPEELKNIQFANHGGLNTEGLGEEELKELQRQIDFIKKMKNKKEK
jgi:transcriptional regulator with XRE-family HTH domain